MGGKEPLCGLAFIVEGPTEKVLYLEYLSQLCKAKGLVLKKDLDLDSHFHCNSLRTQRNALR